MPNVPIADKDKLPLNREEQFYNAIASDTPCPEPTNRHEWWLKQVSDKIDSIGSGGGSAPLIVTLNDEMTEASHSSTEIYEAVQSGKKVYIDMTDGTLITCNMADSAVCSFQQVAVNIEGGLPVAVLIAWSITENKSVVVNLGSVNLTPLE